MAVNIIDITDDLMTVKFSGTLAHAELVTLQFSIARLMSEMGMIRFLGILENFQGWAKDGNWGDISFESEHDTGMEKMALVGDRKWEELVRIFTGQGARPFPIRYFLPEEMNEARRWLAEPA